MISEGNHYTAKVLINNQWVPIDVSDWYGWFGTDSTAIAQIHEQFPEELLTEEDEIEDLFVIIRFQSSTNYLKYDMKTFDPDQYNWYKTNVWPYLT
ncbi:MAG: hypothetical protein ACFFB5_11775 [Promethearchaeota archaeon]